MWLVVGFLLVLSFITGIQYNQKQLGQNATGISNVFNQGKISGPTPQNAPANFTLFWQVWNLVINSYFDKSKIDPQKMYYGAISGMVASLGDPYTTFLHRLRTNKLKMI